ncbi:glycosyl transferases group 1 domain-containing protein [Pycnococcus provasolii]
MSSSAAGKRTRTRVVCSTGLLPFTSLLLSLTLSLSGLLLASAYSLRDVRVDWLIECGCTGLEVEAVRLARDLLSRHGLHDLGLPTCTDTCISWAEADHAALRIANGHYNRRRRALETAVNTISSRSNEDIRASLPVWREAIPDVVVVHVSFLGVCGVPKEIRPYALKVATERGTAFRPDARRLRLLGSAFRPDERRRRRRLLMSGGETSVSYGSWSMPPKMRRPFLVARAMTEVDVLEQAAARRCSANFDEVWVPSASHYEQFLDAGVPKSKLRVVWETVNLREYLPWSNTLSASERERRNVKRGASRLAMQLRTSSTAVSEAELHGTWEENMDDHEQHQKSRGAVLDETFSENFLNAANADDIDDADADDVDDADSIDVEMEDASSSNDADDELEESSRSRRLAASFYPNEITLPPTELAVTEDVSIEALFPSNPSAIVFLSVFKFEERKGWRVLLQSWVRAFVDEPRAMLYIKTSPYMGADPVSQVRIALMRELRANPDVKGNVASHDIWRRVAVDVRRWPARWMPSLYRAAHAFVLPTRGEGWGLPLMEAASCALPIITTKVGGAMEFLDSRVAYLVPPKAMVAADPMVAAGARWAEPNADGFYRALLAVFENVRVASHKGALARQKVAAKFGKAAAAGQAAAGIRDLMMGRCQEYNRAKVAEDPSLHICASFLSTRFDSDESGVVEGDEGYNEEDQEDAPSSHSRDPLQDDASFPFHVHTESSEKDEIR